MRRVRVRDDEDWSEEAMKILRCVKAVVIEPIRSSEWKDLARDLGSIFAYCLANPSDLRTVKFRIHKLSDSLKATPSRSGEV